MAKKTLNTGTTANDGQGDTLRDAAGKINDNFAELYDVAFDGASGSGYLTPEEINTLLELNAILATGGSEKLVDSAEIQARIAAAVATGSAGFTDLAELNALITETLVDSVDIQSRIDDAVTSGTAGLTSFDSTNISTLADLNTVANTTLVDSATIQARIDAVAGGASFTDLTGLNENLSDATLVDSDVIQTRIDAAITGGAAGFTDLAGLNSILSPVSLVDSDEINTRISDATSSLTLEDTEIEMQISLSDFNDHVITDATLVDSDDIDQRIANSSGHVIENAGTVLTQRGTINFTGAGVTASDVGGKTVVDIPTGTGDLDGLSDVDLTTDAPTSGDFLQYDGTEWVPEEAAVDIADLDAADPLVGDELIPCNQLGLGVTTTPQQISDYLYNPITKVNLDTGLSGTRQSFISDLHHVAPGFTTSTNNTQYGSEPLIVQSVNGGTVTALPWVTETLFTLNIADLSTGTSSGGLAALRSSIGPVLLTNDLIEATVGFTMKASGLSTVGNTATIRAGWMDNFEGVVSTGIYFDADGTNGSSVYGNWEGVAAGKDTNGSPIEVRIDTGIAVDSFVTADVADSFKFVIDGANKTVKFYHFDASATTPAWTQVGPDLDYSTIDEFETTANGLATGVGSRGMPAYVGAYIEKAEGNTPLSLYLDAMFFDMPDMGNRLSIWSL